MAVNSSNEKLRALVESMKNYGSYAQVQFNYGTPVTPTDDLSQITDDMLTSYAYEASEDLEGISWYGSNLTLESETTLRHFFEVEEGSIDDYTFTVGGQEVTPNTTNVEGFYCIEIPNIAAKDLDTAYVITVSDGENTMTLTFIALSYANMVLNSTSTAQSLKNVVKALFAYNQAANVYFNN